MKDSEAFDYFSTDPLQWLATGKSHWLCAAFLRDELKRIMPASSTIEEVKNKKLALMNTLMLLTGYCFENLFKGLAAARKLEVKKVCKARGGHGILTYGSALLALSAEEKRLLERVKEFAVWAGKYAAPREKQTFIDVEKRRKRSMRFDDAALGEQLIARIESEIMKAIANP